MNIRRYQQSDCIELAELFFNTVHTVNARDYTKEQLNAWANGQVDLEKWNRSLEEHFSLVAVENEVIVGFGDIDTTGYLDRLYIHPDYQGKGIATAICDRLEQAVQGDIVTHASITARPFFENRGYRVVKEQQVERQGVFLTNFIMKKEAIMLFDSHAHINNESYTEAEREVLIKEIEESALSYVMDIGFDLPSSVKAAEHAARLTWCYAAVGVHPHDADSMTEETLAEIEALAQKEKVRAIGEIGLDFHYDNSDRKAQEYWFRRQIQLANKLKMPVVIHSREADQLTLDILKEEGAFSEERKSWFPKRRRAVDILEKDARVLLHCFSGSRELGQQLVKLGATLSVAGPVTYKNNRKTTEVVEAIPIEYLLVETDSPYLTPVPFRGRPNKPLYVEHTARRVALIKGMSYEEAAAKTMENAKVFFNIK